MLAREVVPVVLLAGVGFVGGWGFFTRDDGAPVAQFASSSSCHASYSGACLPIVYDLDCRDVPGTVYVVGPDVYNLDADSDGLGCEPRP